MTGPLSAEVTSFNWLINSFVADTPAVSYAIVVSGDGLLIAASDGLPRAHADQLSAVVSGLASLTFGVSRLFETGEVEYTVTQMAKGMLLTMAVSDHSVLAVLAERPCEVGQVSYRMAHLREKVGRVLTPELREKVRQTLPPAQE